MASALEQFVTAVQTHSSQGEYMTVLLLVEYRLCYAERGIPNKKTDT